MKVICVGSNYKAHIEEMGSTPAPSSQEPILFMKPDTALLTDHKSRFFIPDFSSNIHHEIELVVRINKMGKNIAERFAHRYYDELTVGIDFTARDLQNKLKNEGMPWEISKAFDNSAAVGRYISKSNLLKNIDNLNFHLTKNENTVQMGDTGQLIHSVDQLIAYASKFFTLKTGDLLFTGTPAGVGKVEVGDRLQGFLENEKLFDLLVC